MKETLRYLFSRRNLGIKLGLDRTYALLKTCGDPGREFPVIQVAGTNGKGSTAAFLSAILKAAGYTAGLSTSPHLAKVNERIRINGKSIPDEEIMLFVDKYKKEIEHIGASFFEILTVMGLWYFRKNRVDAAVMETGLGGRLDSVTALRPRLTLMTNISLDHVEILGHTLQEIAREKAGIFKPGIPCLSVDQPVEAWQVLKEEAEKNHTPLKKINEAIAESWELGLAGSHQIKNASLAAEAAGALKHFVISEPQIRSGLAHCKWPGRNQVINLDPLIIFDVGHNEEGIRAFLAFFQKHRIRGNKILVLALEARKEITGVIPDLETEFHRIICTETKSRTKMPVQTLAEKFTEKSRILIEPDTEIALETALAQTGPEGALAIVGTHYIGDVIHKYFKISFEEL
ncbi:MAG: hypothetical protein GXO91_01565 [FCB group bacterium]|nr:hypothetical protein [FCB group bacterium]